MMRHGPIVRGGDIGGVVVTLCTFIMVSFFVAVISVVVEFPLRSRVVSCGSVRTVMVGMLTLLVRVFFFTCNFIGTVQKVLSPGEVNTMVITFFTTAYVAKAKGVMVGSGIRVIL